ncbi:RecQ family ATP-dependent DNA helicase [Curtobacterium sp. RRHDQ10]|uniref:RecQ family ATP-dependent DNA helicase n=1 Tax=Curtobacterium phyllosphaerae TaxID=3413379 RepID=UPI003BF3E3E5
MTTITQRAESAARDHFGWGQLHDAQLAGIESVVRGRDTVVVMPTGYGKSAVYQVAALLLDGPTVVVSPLIALQEDQVAGLAARQGGRTRSGTEARAVALNSSRSASDADAAWDALERGAATYLFLAPEQLAKDDVVDRLVRLGVALFVVDEAHCVSSWGHDFRPDYLALGEVVDRLGHPPVLAMTATGSGPVRRDVVDRLGMREPLVLASGFDRPNLRLEVVRHEDDDAKRDAVADQVAALPVPGLVYVATRKDTLVYADALGDRGRRARAYHAGLRASERESVHRAFLDGEVDVVVATSAFGMGIDKPDVRFVVHADVPESIDAYYQEIGRAGRDGEPAVATLHYRQEDLGLRRFFSAGLPARSDLRAVHRAVPVDRPIRRSDLARSIDRPARSVGRVVNALIAAGALEESSRGLRRSDAAMSDRAAADAAVASAEDRERVDGSRIAMMQEFAETSTCRRQFLLGYFGDELAEPCGSCDTCSDGSAVEAVHAADGSSDTAFPPDTAVEHAAWGHGTVMSTEEDRITVFFESMGYRTLALADVRDRELLHRV